MQPGMGTFDDQTDSRMKKASILVMLVITVGVDTIRMTEWAAAHAVNRRDGLDQRDQLGDIATIRAGQDCCDQRAVGVGGDVVFETGSRSIGGVRASFLSAPTARVDEGSTTREKSVCPAARSYASACSRSHTPACYQSRSLRHQLTREPHPISVGGSRRRMPVFSTNQASISAARSRTGLRPRYMGRRDFAGGKRGSISAHSSSSVTGFVLSQRSRLTGCCMG